MIVASFKVISLLIVFLSHLKELKSPEKITNLRPLVSYSRDPFARHESPASRQLDCKPSFIQWIRKINSDVVVTHPVHAMGVPQKVQEFITQNVVTVFSKTTCPYCTRVKSTFETLNVPIFVYELDENADGPEIQAHLFELTKQKTVPNVFVRGQHVGGCDNVLKAVADGSLQSLLTVPQPDETQSLSRKVQDLIGQNVVTVFSKTTCPYCTRVKSTFETLNVPIFVYELDENADGPDIQAHLFELTKQKTVPNVFVRGQHVGGCDNVLKAVADGSLQSMLADETQSLSRKVQDLIGQNVVTVFSKTTCPYCTRVKATFQSLNVPIFVYELDENADGPEIQSYLHGLTAQKTVPNVFVRGQHVGGCDNVLKAVADGSMLSLLTVVQSGDSGDQDNTQSYDYDLFVIGGGSGGLAAAKEAAALGKRVGLADFVTPSPIGTTWGLGGTCVNVGCIPKKLMHQASLLGEYMHDASSFGWNLEREKVTHRWEVMVENVQNYIKSLNFGYRKEMNKKNVKYVNAFAEMVTPNQIKLTKKNGQSEEVTAASVLIAVGGRPVYPDIPGAKEFGITSDDIFSLEKPPGRTLIVGASYIALECGGFLRGLGFDVTIVVRSILLRGFDQQMAKLIGEDMERMGVVFKRNCVPSAVSRGPDDKLVVRCVCDGVNEDLDGYDTVIFAIGREACTSNLGFDKVPVKLNPKNKKIIVDNAERSSIPSIYAIGDVIDGKPELTPVAIQAGRLLAQRLSGVHNRLTNYRHIATTVFTPLEYGCVGMSEEDAVVMFGQNNVVIYHNAFKPLEHALSRDVTVGYAKLICVKSLEELVVGFHVVSPNAGEITQGFGIALKLGAKKSDFDDLVGIHPTTAEVFTTLNIVKGVGDAPPETSGC